MKPAYPGCKDGPLGPFRWCIRAAYARLVGNERDVDVHGWFRDDELEQCPFCHKKAAVPNQPGISGFCLACEAVWMEDTEPHPL